MKSFQISSTKNTLEKSKDKWKLENIFTTYMAQKELGFLVHKEPLQVLPNKKKANQWKDEQSGLTGKSRKIYINDL